MEKIRFTHPCQIKFLIDFSKMDTDRRKSQRQVTQGTIAITSLGCAQVINFTMTSVLFRFTQIIDFPDYLEMDLYEQLRLNLVGVFARKIRARAIVNSNDSIFKSEVAVAFENLSSHQQYQLSSYLRQLVESGEGSSSFTPV